MSWSPEPELFELVTWADIAEGDHVWSMGGVCVITDTPTLVISDLTTGENIMRFPHRNESGSEFAPPFELAARVPRLIPPGRGITENDARAALPAAIYGFQQDMLHRNKDITDNAVWRPAKREFLRWLIHLAYRELRTTTPGQEG
jgi:hypothetical protein